MVASLASTPAPTLLNAFDEAAMERTDAKDEWHKLVLPYRVASTRKSLFQLFSNLAMLVTLAYASYAALEIGWWLSAPITLVAGGVFVRLFIIQHDCGHGSFFAEPKWNDLVGTLIGYFMMTPYYAWRRGHAIHHATTGDLDRRGTGDVPTLTLKEYQALPGLQRFAYRVIRNPAVLFIAGSFIIFVIVQRFTNTFLKDEQLDAREKRNIHVTTIAGIAMFAALFWFFGWRYVAFVHFPAAMVGSSVGIFLFYVQHQFDDAYWRRHESWNYAKASMAGSSYLKLPRLLQFFSGNIGIHHIHHLAPRVPNYNLQPCLDQNPYFQRVTTLGFWDALKTTRLKVYDEDAGRMIGWREVDARSAAVARPS